MPGLDRADSVTIDPHKWFFQAYDIGGLLVRRGDDLLDVYHHSPEYYRGGEAPAARRRPRRRTTRPEQLNFYQRSLEGTRRWRALKLWLSWKHLGTDGLGRLVEANDDLAAYLARRCAEADDFEALPAEPELSVVCFRHLPGGAAAAARGSIRPRSTPTRTGSRRRSSPRATPGSGRPAARRDLAPGRDRQLPRDRGRHRPDPRRPPPPRRATSRSPTDERRPAARRPPVHVAELNIGRTVAPLDDPALADFVDNLERINALGDASPGFVWRLQDEFGAATTIRAFDDPLMIVNLTVWETIEALRAFAYRSDHVEYLRRRREWFEPLDGPSLVLWWVPAGHRPTVDEARDRLDRLAADGPSPAAFTLKTTFPPDG